MHSMIIVSLTLPLYSQELGYAIDRQDDDSQNAMARHVSVYGMCNTLLGFFVQH